MATPSGGYFNHAGKRLPGTTTIISRFKESGGLIHWAWTLGMEGRDYKAERDSAGSTGTLAHDMVEAHILGNDPDAVLQAADEGIDTDRAFAAFEAYLHWERHTKLSIVTTEVQLVSEQFQYGGTPDAIGKIGGELCLLDWKTSNRVYPDYLLQLAAYKHLVEEGFILEGKALTDRRLDMKLTGGFHLCRFSKEYGDFAHYYFDELDDAWEAFRHLRLTYDLMAKLKKRAA